MFENIVKFFKSLGKSEKESKSKDAAKERLHLVLMQDRANISADFLALMKQEIIEVIKKYIDVDENAIDVRLTNKANEDGTTGAPVLYANIPIMSVKEEAKEEVRKEKKKEQEKAEKQNKSEDKKTETKTTKTESKKMAAKNEDKKQDSKVEESKKTEKKDKKEKAEEIIEEKTDNVTEVIEKAEEIVEEIKEEKETKTTSDDK